jgi:hypothetical protein
MAPDPWPDSIPRGLPMQRRKLSLVGQRNRKTSMARVWRACASLGGIAKSVASLIYLPRYVRDWQRFQKLSGGDLHYRDGHPCLTDWLDHTPFDPHYFYQAVWLARCVAARKPQRHTDIGSDIRIFNTLSAFVPVEFIDFRPLRVDVDGLTCIQGNLTELAKPSASIPSLSCLHVIEHVGLGRYGDTIDPAGSTKALAELQRVLAPGGMLYISTPVGRQRVCFNAHRIFRPETIIATLQDLQLVEFSLIDDSGNYRAGQAPAAAEDLEYGCGLFSFTKP